MNATTATQPRVESLSVSDLEAQAAPLLEAHYAELGKPDPSICWNAYRKLADIGMLVSLGAFVGDSLVGYALAFVMERHLHYDFGTVHVDLFYVAKHERGLRDGREVTIGDMLRAELKREARRRGASKVYWRAKPGSAMENWLCRHGAAFEEIAFLEDC